MKCLFILAAALPALFPLADLSADYRRRLRDVLRKESEKRKDSLAASYFGKTAIFGCLQSCRSHR
jgi:hypothetical protein